MKLGQLVVLAVIQAGTHPAFAASRALAVVSDLHFGVGKSKGEWHPYEDFRWDADWTAFLAYIDDKGGHQTDLVLNGDTFELWQSVIPSGNKDCNGKSGCNEEEALARFSHVLAQHSVAIKALVDFANKGENHVYLVPGNHDAALYFDKVAAAWNKAVAGAGARITLLTSGYWQSEDKLIVADHGHQNSEDVNSFSRWPYPFDATDGENRLIKTWGEQFVQSFYNSYEQTFPIIDNMTSEAEGLKQALKHEQVRGTIRATARFLKFILLDESWNQMKQALSSKAGAPKKWKYEAIRKEGEKFLQESFEEGNPMRAVDPEPLDVPLTDSEIDALCGLREAMAKKNPKSVTTCASEKLGHGGTTLGAVAASVLRDRAKEIRKHVFDSVKQPATKVYVYSHTHKAESFELDGGKVHVLNTGAFQRLATPEWLKRRAEADGRAEHLTFAALKPNDLPPCYDFVWIAPYEKAGPDGKLFGWKESGGRHSAIEGGCR